jgi:hypothetical protein
VRKKVPVADKPNEQDPERQVFATEGVLYIDRRFSYGLPKVQPRPSLGWRIPCTEPYDYLQFSTVHIYHLTDEATGQEGYAVARSSATVVAQIRMRPKEKLGSYPCVATGKANFHHLFHFQKYLYINLHFQKIFITDIVMKACIPFKLKYKSCELKMTNN